MSTRHPRATRAFGFRSLVAMVGAVGASVVMVGCPGTLEDPERFDVTESPDADVGSDSDPGVPGCSDITTTLFQPVCATSGCHSATDPTSGLDLQSPDVFARLAGKMAAGGPGTLLDEGGDPAKSVVYLKMTDTPPFGSQMPLGGPTISSQELACVAGWIAAQAK